MTEDRQTWLEQRRHGLGGSDIAGILGLSKWSSPYSVWAEKVHGITEDLTPERQARLDAGTDAEPFLRASFMRRTGLYPHDEQERYEHPDHEWAFVHVDGIVYDPCDEALGVWEAKTDNDYTPWTEIPAYYLAQVQWAMWITDLPRAYVTVGFSGWKVETYDVERDEADIALIVDAASTFWHDHVLAQVAPEVDGHDATADAIASHWPQHDEGEHVDIDPADLVAWRSLRDEEKRVKGDLAAVKARIAARLADAEYGDLNGEPAVTYRSQTRVTACSNCGHESTSKPFRVLRDTTNKGKQ